MIALAGRPILLLLYRPEYAEHVAAFLLLAAATALGYVASILGYAMTAARYFRAQLPVIHASPPRATAAGCAHARAAAATARRRHWPSSLGYPLPKRSERRGNRPRAQKNGKD